MNELQPAAVSQQILDYIHLTFPRARANNASAADRLLDLRYIDSLGLLDIITYLEDTYQIIVRNEDVVDENFATVDSISRFVCRTLNT